MTVHSKAKQLTISTLPTSPATAVRLKIYQPSRRPIPMMTDWIPSPWGKCRVKGRLGQRHADLIDIFMHKAERLFTEPGTGRIQLMVDPYVVRQAMSSKAQYSYSTTWNLIDEIMSCVVEWETKKGKGRGHIIDSVTESTVKRRNPLTNKSRLMLKITVGECWSELLRKDISLRYDPSPIIALKHGISQAVVRNLLSHNRDKMSNGIKINTMFDWLDIPTSGQTRRKFAFRLREDLSGLKALGFTIDDEIIRPTGVNNE